MNRRFLLGLLAASPVAAIVKPAEAAPVAPPLPVRIDDKVHYAPLLDYATLGAFVSCTYIAADVITTDGVVAFGTIAGAGFDDVHFDDEDDGDDDYGGDW